MTFGATISDKDVTLTLKFTGILASTLSIKHGFNFESFSQNVD